jgi:23S rRNA (cytidine1920-2'-O)/16S rRNA (cytidine1409-2'-O)-methyltransferase
MKKFKKRIEAYKLLVKQGLATCEQEARALIMAGKLIADDQRVDKAGCLIPVKSHLRLNNVKEFVSRGGNKLRSGLEALSINSNDLFCGSLVIDIGSSTGGFTDFALKSGASSVFALDVGQNQLHWSLRCDPRVVSLEKTDIREFNKSSYPNINVVLADISFNSIQTLAPAILSSGTKPFHSVVLVKPQFECPKELVPKGGVVLNSDIQKDLLEKIQKIFRAKGAQKIRSAACPIKGLKGNQEYFLYSYFE